MDSVKLSLSKVKGVYGLCEVVTLDTYFFFDYNFLVTSFACLYVNFGKFIVRFFCAGIKNGICDVSVVALGVAGLKEQLFFFLISILKLDVGNVN